MWCGSRTGISRFGMGMKTAALSMSPVVEIYSWQESAAIYRIRCVIFRYRQDLLNWWSGIYWSYLPKRVRGAVTRVGNGRKPAIRGCSLSDP
jgi:hypothetical protein